MVFFNVMTSMSEWGKNRLELHFFFKAEDGIRDFHVTGVQTCALPISGHRCRGRATALSRGTTGNRHALTSVPNWSDHEPEPTAGAAGMEQRGARLDRRGRLR